MSHIIHVSHDSFVCSMSYLYEIWLIHVRHMKYDSFMWDIWNMTHSCETWLIRMSCEMSHMNESCFIWMSHVSYERVMSMVGLAADVMNKRPTTQLVSLCQLTHVNVSFHKYEWVMSHMNESCLIWTSHVYYRAHSDWDEREADSTNWCDCVHSHV